MSGTITLNSFGKALWPGLNSWFGMNYKETDQEWRPCFEILQSNQRYEEDQNSTGLGLAPIKPEGTATQYDSMKQSYNVRYTNVAYSLGFIITHEMKKDNLYAQLGNDMASELGRAGRQTKEIVHANIFNRAFNSSYTGGDGVELCATTHPIEGGTMANKPSVDISLSEAALEQAVIDIEGFTDNRGNIRNISPKALLVPTSLQFEAKRILGGDERYNTANRDINAMYHMGTIPMTVVNRYLTDNNAWFVLTDCPKGLRHFVREAPEFKQDNDFDTDNNKFKFYERYVAGWTDFRSIYGSSGA
jgi:hypothetical protein